MKKMDREGYRENKEKLQIIMANLMRNGIEVFEYIPEVDRMIIYDSNLEAATRKDNYLAHLRKDNSVHPEDCWKMEEICKGYLQHQIEVRFLETAQNVVTRILDVDPFMDKMENRKSFVGIARNETKERQREKVLEEQVKRDPMTKLYNQFFGRELINEYLINKNPYASCGMMVVDIDYFKSVNDVFGHRFGDLVLQKVSRLFMDLFDKRDILVRAGGDEFVIFLKDISHGMLLKKAGQLIEAVRNLKFDERDYSMTCSVGTCFLPENISGYNYDQLFENADWALYEAKENGKNRYEVCDNLKQFELLANRTMENFVEGLDARYLRNDIISTAFEVFEKMNSFNAAIELLMKIIGIRFSLDRITVIQTDIKAMQTGRQYQWTSPSAPEALKVPGSFTKEDFLTLFQSYDEYGTTVLHYDNMSMYSQDAQNLLMQGDAKTVLYAAMYCEGKYTGAISYVVCGQKRYWSKQNRSQLGELTKIISAHLAKSQVLNMVHQNSLGALHYDSLTGLLSFPKFKEETERMIVGGYAKSHVMVYSDFDNFKYFNQKYGYRMGDQVLKEYSNYLIEMLENEQDTYFSRVVADQFVIFMACQSPEQAAEKFNRLNEAFLKKQIGRFKGISFFIRTGIYPVQSGDISSSAAIDAANYARCQVKKDGKSSVVIYDSHMAKRKQQENEIINGMSSAMENGEFQVYFQPRFSLQDFSITGAEALIRWKRQDGTMIYPDEFIPLYEKNGRIAELDMYVLEQVAAFQEKIIQSWNVYIPIAVNLSLRHASRLDTVEKYQNVLDKHGLDSSVIEIELTETGTVPVNDYHHIKRIFGQFRKKHFRTAMDDFGSGYSMLNMLIDIPVDTIKLDRVFVHYCESNDQGVRFLKQLVAMVKGLGYHLVCEGIETEEQADILKNIGCEEGQGYWFARPMPMEDFEEFLVQKIRGAAR